MQTSYSSHLTAGVEGMPIGRRMSRSYSLPDLAQVQTITIADGSPAAAEAWTIDIVDDFTAQAYQVAFSSGASLALTLDAMVAAFQAHPKVNDLLSITEDGATVATLTANHKQRSYTVTVTPGGSATAAVAETTAFGGAKIPFGRAVVRGSGTGEFALPGASTVANDVLGLLFRTDANHSQSRADSEDPDAIDGASRGKMYSIMEQGRCLVLPEEAVSPGDAVYLRRALTSGAGTLGGFRASPAGSAQVATVTPTAAELDFLIMIEYTPPSGTKQSVPLLSANPDGSASQTEICDAWRTAAATAQADGLLAGFTFGGTSTLTVTGPAGESFLVADVGEGVSAVADTTPADVDAIDVSALFEWETAGSSTQLARLKVKMA